MLTAKRQKGKAIKKAMYFAQYFFYHIIKMAAKRRCLNIIHMMSYNLKDFLYVPSRIR